MNPTVAILSVGNEVLRGCVTNTNAAFLGRELTGLGFEVVSHVVCADSQEAIRFRLGEALRRADVVFMMGGLGPTPDDVTREGIAAHFNVPLVFSPEHYARPRKIYKRYGKRIPALVKREAYFPENAQPLDNRFGIALGFAIEVRHRLVIALPGVPSELENMFFDVVLPLLKRKFLGRTGARTVLAKLVGIGEPDVMKRLGKDFFNDPFDFGIYPDAGEVTLRIRTEKRDVAVKVRAKIRSRLKDFLYATEDLSFPAVLGRIMTARKKTLAVAESCTGGLLASKITAQPGASRFSRGATVAYHALVKKKLGVPEAVLRRRGEVSREVAGELAAWVRTRMEADYGIGITGIAGPDGGSAAKPVGLVYIGIAGPSGKARVWKHVFYGERSQIQNKAAVKALEYLWRTIR